MLRHATTFLATQEHFHFLPKTRNTANTQYLANRKTTNWTFFTKYCAVKLHVLAWVWLRPLSPLESKLFCHALLHFYQEPPLPPVCSAECADNLPRRPDAKPTETEVSRNGEMSQKGGERKHCTKKPSVRVTASALGDMEHPDRRWSISEHESWCCL